MASKQQTHVQSLKDQPHRASAFSVGTVQPQTTATGTPAAATDLASVIALANFLRTSLLANGVIG